MPEYLSPGVYIEEVATGPRPIEGVGTSTAGFAGRTERGPRQPRLVASWSEYVRWFGGYLDPAVSYLPFAVKGFFDNGGQRAFVARVIGNGSGTAAVPLPAAGGQTITLEAIGPGAWGNNLLVRVMPPASAAAVARGFFRLTILYYADGIPGPFLDPTDVANVGNPLLVQPDGIEDYETLSPEAEDANFYLTVLNSRSTLVHAPDNSPEARPNDVAFPRNAQVDLATGDANTALRAIAMRTGAANVTIAVRAGTSAGTALIETVYTEDQLDALTPANVVTRINAESHLVTASFQLVGPGALTPTLPDPVAGAVVGAGGAIDLVAAAAPNTVLRLAPRVAGGAGLAATVAAGAAAGTIDLTLVQTDDFDNLTPANLVGTVNGGSRFVRVEWVRVNPPTPFTPTLPTIPTAATPLAGGSGSVPTTGGDGTFSEATYIGNSPLPSQRTGLAALGDIDEVAILCAPDEADAARFPAGQITDAIVNQCERLKDRFGVLSIGDRTGNITGVRPPRDSSYAAVYYPFIRIMDPRTQTDILIPPTGHIVGIYARTDIERGVHKAPANVVVRGILTRDLSADRRPLEFTLAKGEHDLLNPRGVNVIRDFRPYRRDLRVWGARTMSSDGQWRYVNVRRLFIFVEESIDKGTQWVVFEPNDETTWSAVRRSITGFLTSVWRSGALFGATADEAFFVKCDRTTMSPDDLDNGRLICLIGIAPVKPAEFVIFRISQKTVEAQP